MYRSLASLLPAIALLAAISGCRKEAPPGGPTQDATAAALDAAPPVAEAPAPDAAPAAETPSRPAAPTVDTTKVELVDAGKEPRTPLRYALASGKQVTQFNLVMTMITKADGQAGPDLPLPGILMTVESEVLEVLPDGAAKVRFTFTDVDAQDGKGVDPNVLASTSQTLESMVGIVGQATVEPRGFYRDIDVKLPDGVNPQMRQTLENTMQTINQVSSPLPEEPIGIGGSWKVTQRLNQGGLELEQTTTYTLKKRTRDGAVLDAVVAQSASPQTLSPGGGGSVKVLSVSTAGKGNITIAVKQLMPAAASIDMESNASMEMTSPGAEKPQRLDMTTTFKMDVGSPKK